MIIILNRSATAEWGIYKESGAIVIGWKFHSGERISYLIIQIEEDGSELAADNFGMHVEIDGTALYGGVSEYRYDELHKRVELALHPGKFDGIEEIHAEIPSPRSASDEQMLREFAKSYRNSLVSNKAVSRPMNSGAKSSAK